MVIVCEGALKIQVTDVSQSQVCVWNDHWECCKTPALLATDRRIWIREDKREMACIILTSSKTQYNTEMYPWHRKQDCNAGALRGISKHTLFSSPERKNTTYVCHAFFQKQDIKSVRPVRMTGCMKHWQHVQCIKTTHKPKNVNKTSTWCHCSGATGNGKKRTPRWGDKQSGPVTCWEIC